MVSRYPPVGTVTAARGVSTVSAATPDATLPRPSFTLQVTSVVPAGNVDPEGGSQPRVVAPGSEPGLMFTGALAWSVCTVRSGARRVCEKVARVSVAPVMSAESKMAPLRSASVRSALSSWALDRSAPVRSAPTMEAEEKSDEDASTCSR